MESDAVRLKTGYPGGGAAAAGLRRNLGDSVCRQWAGSSRQSATKAPVLIGGQDGTNAQTLKTQRAGDALWLVPGAPALRRPKTPW